MTALSLADHVDPWVLSFTRDIQAKGWKAVMFHRAPPSLMAGSVICTAYKLPLLFHQLSAGVPWGSGDFLQHCLLRSRLLSKGSTSQSTCLRYQSPARIGTLERQGTSTWLLSYHHCLESLPASLLADWAYWRAFLNPAWPWHLSGPCLGLSGCMLAGTASTVTFVSPAALCPQLPQLLLLPGSFTSLTWVMWFFPEQSLTSPGSCAQPVSRVPREMAKDWKSLISVCFRQTCRQVAGRQHPQTIGFTRKPLFTAGIGVWGDGWFRAGIDNDFHFLTHSSLFKPLLWNATMPPAKASNDFRVSKSYPANIQS